MCLNQSLKELEIILKNFKDAFAKWIASRWNSREPVSRIMAAVSPTPLEPLPVVLMASGAVFITKRSICDFPQLGSPTKSTSIRYKYKKLCESRTLMSPLKWVPLDKFFSSEEESLSFKVGKRSQKAFERAEGPLRLTSAAAAQPLPSRDLTLQPPRRDFGTRATNRRSKRSGQELKGILQKSSEHTSDREMKRKERR